MTEQNTPVVITARDGAAALELLAFQGKAPIPNRAAVGYEFLARRGPRAEPRLLEVRFSYTALAFTPDQFGLPSSDDRDADFLHVAQAAVGEALDVRGGEAFAAEGDVIPHVDCFSPQFQTWADRLPADDAALETYVQARLYWAWKFGHKTAAFAAPDCLRLRVPLTEFARIVYVGQGTEWNVEDGAAETLVLAPTPQFLRAQREAERRGGHASASPAAAGVVPPEPVAMGESARSSVERTAAPGTAPNIEPGFAALVDETRLAELRAIQSTAFDLRKLIALCEELNVTARAQCYFAVAMLTRAVLDHVPPIFNAKSFTELANNHAAGRSFREMMQQLDTFARRIADAHLHSQARAREVLPNRTQVNCASALDVLLAEIVRILA